MLFDTAKKFHPFGKLVITSLTGERFRVRTKDIEIAEQGR